MSPLRQLLLALIIGPILGVGLSMLIADFMDRPRHKVSNYTAIQKQYITGYIGDKTVQLKIIKY